MNRGFEVDVHTRLPESASEPTTTPSIEMDSLVYEGVDSFLDDPDVVEERSEADILEDLPIQARRTRAITAHRAISPGDALQSYLRDIRASGRLTHAEKFDYRRGCHFGSYATWWIRQAVNRPATEQSRLIHLPEHAASRLRKIRRVAAQLSQENGLDPLPEQIAEAAHTNLDEVKKLLSLIEQPVSLDAPLDDEARYSLADTLEDSAASALVETASQRLLGEGLHQALTLLTPRERAVIILRYGIGDGRSRTLLEVGKELGISRERVRQIEVAAFKKMRHHI
jgi:RNA polymerase primary sigma factor